MKKREKVILGLVSTIAVMCGIFAVNGILAYFTDTQEITNHVKTGTVDIHIDEFQKNEDGSETPYEDSKEVIPGEHLSKIVRIVNDEKKAYIRVKPEIRFEDEALREALDISCLEGIDESKWAYLGGYFYHKESVESKGTIQLFDHVIIPESWDNTYAGSKFSITVTAQAIQADNFTPDYSSESPWGDVEIQENIHTGQTDPSESAQETQEIRTTEDEENTESSSLNPDNTEEITENSSLNPDNTEEITESSNPEESNAENNSSAG